ncbi:MAG: XRE family transcriptional regulator [Alphaproteobacteria bacterium]
MAQALVTPEILKWARMRAGLPLDELAKKVGSSSDVVAAWEAGESRPTFRQAEKFAQATYVPFGYLFLSKPPKEDVSIPDLRTTAGTRPLEVLDVNFMDALRDVQFKLDWYRDYRIDHGHGKLPFVGRFDRSAKPAEVAEDMRRTLGVGPSEREQAHTWEDYFRLLIARAEAVGIWVMRNSVVGNTKRPLSVDVFRGFAISDPIVPVIFVNSRDAKAAQVFTFAHELAHVWLGESGISDSFRTSRLKIERLCNAAAAEFLVPEAEFKKTWDRDSGIEENVGDLSKRFRVSRIVIAIRARDLGLIRQSEFDAFFDAERQRWSQERADPKSGGNSYRTAKVRNGGGFLTAVLASAMSGDLLLRNAGALLSMTPKTLLEAYRRLQTGQL